GCPLKVIARLFSLAVEQRRAVQPVADHAVRPRSFQLGERQKVSRQRARLPYVARNSQVRPPRVQRRKDARIIIQGAAEIDGAAAHIGYRVGTKSLYCDRRSDQRNLCVQLQIVPFKSGRELADLLPRRVELCDGLQICRALGCLFCRFEPHLRRARGAAGLRQMLGHVIGLPVGDPRKLEFDLVGDAGVKLPSLPLEKRIVRHVPHQSMLEGVDLFVVIALEPYQSGHTQLLECEFKGVPVLTRNGRQKSVRKTAPDHRRDLSDRLGMAQSLETEHERVVECRWHLHGPTGNGIDLTGLERRRRQLLYEQWNAVRSRDDLLDQLARQPLVADDGAGEIAAVVIVKALKQDAPDRQRSAANSTRATGDQKQNRRVADLGSDAFDYLDRRWIGPVKVLEQYQAHAAASRRCQQLHNGVARLPTPLLRVGNCR